MKHTWRRMLCTALAVMLLFGCLSAAALATDGAVLTGTYCFTSSAGGDPPETDTFVWRDECFRRSSFEGCDHLRLLSAQTAIASASRLGTGAAPYEQDAGGPGDNIKAMLTDMGFRDVRTNGYYQSPALENSAAVAVGHRTITVGERDCTLLAVIPRSAGYRQEWAGNFNVGEGMMHAGFKAARDEDLRFVKQYISDCGITGSLKVWIAGHSRGAAVANLLGGFFAGGGAAYFGEGVSVTPEDVYCYTFATPRTIVCQQDGGNLTKAEALSVAGGRGGDYAGFDTVQDAYVYKGSGTVDPKDDVYKGIRNYPFAYDFITCLPPAEWGFTNYGQTIENGMSRTMAGEAVSPDAMAAELKTISGAAYREWMNGGDFRAFREMDFDPATLSLIPVEGGGTGEEGMSAFIASFIGSLPALIGEKSDYTGQYQEMMTALAGLYGMTVLQFSEQYLKNADALILPVILSYLAYAYECSPDAVTESAAATRALVELVDCLTGAETAHDPATYTLDELVEQVAECFDGFDAPPALLTLLAEQIPEETAVRLKSSLSSLAPADGGDGFGLDALLLYTLKACTGGSGSTDAAGIRKALYGMVYLGMTLGTIKVPDEVSTYLRSRADDLGAVPVSDLAGLLLPLLTGADESGNPRSLAAAADEALRAGLNKLIGVPGRSGAYDEDSGLIGFLLHQDPAIYDDGYRETFIKTIEHDRDVLTGDGSITLLRRVLSCLLFRTEGVSAAQFDTAATVRKLATFAGCVNMIPPAHYNEVFVAWGKAAAAVAAGAAACPRDATCPISAYSDADPAAWYHDGIHFCLENGIMQGVGEGRFAPDAPASRAMMAQILYNMEGRPMIRSGIPFDDVTESDWFAMAVSWAESQGILGGYGNGKFGPGDDVTREMLVTILYRYAQYKGMDVSAAERTSLEGFDDVAAVSEWALSAMRWAVGTGLITGRTPTALVPAERASRAEIATIIMRFFSA